MGKPENTGKVEKHTNQFEFSEFNFLKGVMESGDVMVRKIIRSFFFILLISSIAFLTYTLVIEPTKVKKDIDELKKVYYDDSLNKFEELRKINSEICGWIYVADTNIDYPVLYRKGNSQFYLSHNYKKVPSRYGSIALDNQCVQGVNSKNIILHGHHMNNGQMFADLLKFTDIEFSRRHQTIRFDTADSNGVWKVFSVFRTNISPQQGPVFNYLIPDFNDEKSFLGFILEIKDRSLINFPVDVNYNDQILTLSTCSYEYKNFRTVVVARKLRDGESETAEYNKVIEAQNPILPECYYS